MSEEQIKFFTELIANFDAKFEKFDEKFDKLQDRLEGKIDSFIGIVGNQQEKISDLKNEFSTQFTSLEANQNFITDKIDDLKKDVKNIADKGRINDAEHYESINKLNILTTALETRVEALENFKPDSKKELLKTSAGGVGGAGLGIAFYEFIQQFINK